MRNFLYKHRLWPPKPSELADGDKVRANRSLRTKGLTPVHLPKNKEPIPTKSCARSRRGQNKWEQPLPIGLPTFNLPARHDGLPTRVRGKGTVPPPTENAFSGNKFSKCDISFFFRDVALSAENSRRTELKGYKGGGIVYLKKSAPDNLSTACSFEIRRYLSNAEMLLCPDANIQSRTGTPER